MVLRVLSPDIMEDCLHFGPPRSQSGRVWEPFVFSKRCWCWVSLRHYRLAVNSVSMHFLSSHARPPLSLPPFSSLLCMPFRSSPLPLVISQWLANLFPLKSNPLVTRSCALAWGGGWHGEGIQIHRDLVLNPSSAPQQMFDFRQITSSLLPRFPHLSKKKKMEIITTLQSIWKIRDNLCKVLDIHGPISVNNGHYQKCINICQRLIFLCFIISNSKKNSFCSINR